MIRSNPAAIGIGAPIQCERAFSRGFKTKIPQTKSGGRTGGMMERSNPKSVERLRANARSF